MIVITQKPLAGTRTNTGVKWEATTVVEGVAYRAASRHGAPMALARVMVEAGVADQPVDAGGIRYSSLHRLAGWTITEGAKQSVRRVRYQEADFSQMGNPALSVPPHSAETGSGEGMTPAEKQAPVLAPPLSVTCQGCGRDFTPKRSDAKTCGPACRQRARRAA